MPKTSQKMTEKQDENSLNTPHENNLIKYGVRLVFDYLQHSQIISLLIIVLVFVSCVFLLRMPKQSNLPDLPIGTTPQQSIDVAMDHFTYVDISEQKRFKDSFADNFSRFFRQSTERTREIKDEFGLLVREVLRKSAAEGENRIYSVPEDADEKTMKCIVFLNEIPFQLYDYLKRMAMNESQIEDVNSIIGLIVDQGIATDEELAESRKSISSPLNGERTFIVNDDINAVIIDSDSQEHLRIRLDRILTPTTAAAQTAHALLSRMPDDDLHHTCEEKLLSFFVQILKNGNLSYDYNYTLSQMEKAYEMIPAVKRNPEKRFNKGTILIHKGETITEELSDLYVNYKTQYGDYCIHSTNKWSSPSLLGKIVIVFFLLIMSCFFIQQDHPALKGNNGTILLIASVVIISISLNRPIATIYHDYISANGFPLLPQYLVMPLALPALVLASIYSGRSAVFAGLFVSGVSSIAMDFSFPAFVSGLLVCAVGTWKVRNICDYKKFIIQSFVWCAFTLCVASLVFLAIDNIDSWMAIKSDDWIALLKNADLRKIATSKFGFSLILPLVSSLITTGLSCVLIFVLELFVPTNMYYLSKTNRSHPLLKQLQNDAPGTYEHSVNVARLAEEAAAIIGAMPQKVEAYALFHDIGKLESPDMFTENCEGKNLLDEKTPLECATIIRKHVENGVKLARKHNLRTPIQRAIACHHGNGFISIFYKVEMEQTGTTPPEDLFRYPGPLPSELECVILMLADCCEAAVRSLQNPTEDSIRGLVEKIFNDKVQNKQLDEAGVTIKQLSLIRESFLRTLKTMKHTRFSYSNSNSKK